MSDYAVYRDAARTADERTEDLLSRMTLEEKLAQMLCAWQTKPTALVDERGEFDAAKAKASFGHGHGLGQVGRPSDAAGGRTARQMAELTNAIQRFFLENSRLGVPVVFHEECLHGHAAPEGTSFPQPIGLGATFDPDLVERLYAMTAREARARGAHQALAPDLDVARDPRWGRTEETFGEDPYLIARMGVAAVRGFQGDASFKDRKRVVATIKHFAAHGEPESGTNCAPVNVSMRVLRDVFLPAFKAAVVEGGALSVMPSYNEIDGVPSHANKWLIEGVLRGEWGFRGFVVSDYFAIRQMNEQPGFFGHHVASDRKQAAALAVRAGVDIELPDPDCYPCLADLVREGTIPESLIDDRVRPLLRAKFQLGLFDDPYVDPAEAERVVRDPSHRELAYQAATRTITLLKNEQACSRSIGAGSGRLPSSGRTPIARCSEATAASRSTRARSSTASGSGCGRRPAAKRRPRQSTSSTTKAARSRSAARGARTR
jgi:beta-glucosidase